MNLDCNVVMDLVSLYKDKEISFVTKQSVDKHLKECKNCKKYYSDYAITPRKLDSGEMFGEENYSLLAKKMRKRRSIITTCFLAYVSASICAILFLCKHKNK